MDFYDQHFDTVEALPDQLHNQEFEQCTFKKLDFSKRLLSGTNFINCRFEGCNLTAAELKNTTLHDVVFLNGKLTHLDFGQCNAFGFRVTFRECQLDYTVFLNRNLKKTTFVDCLLREAHFLRCDLTGSTFTNCDLELAKFAECNLSQVNFSTSYNIRIDPDDNILKKARFSLYNLPGLLTKYAIVVVP